MVKRSTSTYSSSRVFLFLPLSLHLLHPFMFLRQGSSLTGIVCLPEVAAET